jgi:hypothetical protein
LKVSLCRIVGRGKGYDELALSSVSSLPFLPSFLTSSPYYNTIFEHTPLEAKDWKIRERLCLSGNGCWLEVVDMLHLRYRPKELMLPEFKVGGRTQTLTWSPEWTELLATKAEGAFGYQGEIEAFAKACLGEGEPASTLWDGAKDLQVAEAVWESANSNKAVQITV